MPVFLELEEDELEWIIACCRLHMNEGDFHTSIIHLLESGLVEIGMEPNTGYSTKNRPDKDTFTTPGNSKMTPLIDNSSFNSRSTSPPVQKSSSQPASTTSSAIITTGNNRKRKISKLTQFIDPGGLLPNPREDPPPVQCQKKRGIFKKWARDVEVAAQASSHLDTIQLISTLAATSINILNDKQNAPGFGLTNASISSPDSVVSYEGNSLRAIAGRIRNREEKGIDNNFEMAISLIQFSLKLDLLQEETKKDFATLIREEIQSVAGGGVVGFTQRQGKRWRAWGTRLVEFVGAASIYGLIILVLSKSVNKYKSSPETVSKEICDIIRAPKEDMDDDISLNVQKAIIPAIFHLQELEPSVSLASVLGDDLIVGRLSSLKLGPGALCSSLQQSDIFFNSLKINHFLEPRNYKVWTGPSHTIPMDTSSAEEEPALKNPVIVLLFDSQCPENQIHHLKRYNEATSNYDFTVKQRLLAKEAKVVKNIEELEDSLDENFSKGYREKNAGFVRLNPDLLINCETITFYDLNGILLLTVHLNMPNPLKSTLLDRFRASLPGHLQQVDTANDEGPEKSCGQAIHFDWYNRYSTLGDGAPKDIHPSWLQKLGKKFWNPVTTSRLVPRQSKELLDNSDQYARFITAWEDVFDWQSEIMKEHHEDICREIAPWIQKLPLNAYAPVEPWSGVVVNGNCATRAHRDVGDDKYCMVLVASDCTGGDLVFHELGLVFSARNGDSALFQSVSLTHYNLDFKGTRGSLVFHSDKAGNRWKEDSNGWKNNAFYN